MFAVGDRVTYAGDEYAGLSGTVTGTRLMESDSRRLPLPAYQRITVKVDPNPRFVWQLEAASRFFCAEVAL